MIRPYCTILTSELKLGALLFYLKKQKINTIQLVEICMQRRRQVIYGIGSAGGAVSLAGCIEDNSLHLTVVNEDGEPIENAYIELQAESIFSIRPQTEYEGVTNESGVYSTVVDDEEYILVVDREGYFEKEIEIIVDEPNSEITVTLEAHEAEFVFKEMSTSKNEYMPSDSVTITMEIINKGGRVGTAYVNIDRFDYEYEITLEPDESTRIVESFDLTQISHNTNSIRASILDGDSESVDRASANIDIIPVFSVNEEFTISEANIRVRLGSISEMDSTPYRSADGIFRTFGFEIENQANEEFTIRRGDIKLIYNNSEIEPTEGISRDLQHGFYIEDINPGISKILAVGYDIPEDAEPEYIKFELGGSLFSSPAEYYISLEEYYDS